MVVYVVNAHAHTKSTGKAMAAVFPKPAALHVEGLKT